MNNILLNNQWVIEEIRGKNLLGSNENGEQNIPEPSSAERKVYSYECLFKNTERSQTNYLMLHLKPLKKIRTS
jgi:hypothetical protein